MLSLLKSLEKYLDIIEMVLNRDKTKIIRFSQARGREPNKKFYWRETEIEKVKVIKYLGYIFQRRRQ